MRLKVFSIISFSFILVMIINSAGGLVGDRIKRAASIEIYERVLSEDSETLIADANPAEREKCIENYSAINREVFNAINRDVSNEYKIYFILNMLAQLIAMAFFAYGATCLATRIICRNNN